MAGCSRCEDEMKETMIREIIKEALVEQEASLKAAISEELKKLILGSTAVGDVNERPAEEEEEEEEDATWKEIPKFGGELGIEEWIRICECYFEEKGISSDDEKVETASRALHMHGSLTWNQYADLLLAHYGEQQKVTSAVPDYAPPSWKYDIFISFRGDDTRKGFASHLFHALKNADINCFRDADGDERGQVVWQMLRDAIHQSMIVLVLFSKNYADSKWCLKELVEILRFNKQYCADGHKVLPIFYDVEPYEVRHQTGIVGEAFKRCEAETKQQKKQWRDALKEAGEISSWTLANREEAEFIEEIVEALQNELFNSRSAYFVKNPVGMKENVDHLISLLDTTPSTTGTRKVGIYGAQGIGKTTLAKMICRQLYKVFNGRVSLLQNIHSVNNNNEGIIRLQSKLIQDVMKIKRPLLSEDKGKNVSDIRKRLYHKKVLLVFDGVENSHEMLSIIGTEPEKFLNPGSVILITTRNKQLLDDLKVDKIDMIPPLDPQDSLQLLYQHALIEETAVSGVSAECKDMCKKLVHYARGLPLAIHTMGTFLFNKPNEWDGVLGMLVRSSSLDSIGIYSDSISDVYGYWKVGPYGGVGTPFDHGRLTTVRKVKLFMARMSESNNDHTIHAMIVDYDYNGSFVSAGKRPGLDDSRAHYSLALDYPDEYLNSVSGYIEENYQCGAIRSIKFYSNKNRHFAYGQEIGTPFSFPDIDSGCIVGFSGNRDDSFLNSIAAHFGPVPNSSPYTTAGPFGGGGMGEYWNNGKYLDIRRIEVLVGDSGVINLIRITYDNYGHPLGPFSHGDETGAGVAHSVEVDYPYEYLTAISGQVTNVVCSLTFHSNRRKYGPFGDEIGQRFFTAQSTGVKIVGFFGRNDIGSGGIESIGVHLEAVSHIHPKRVVGPFGGETGEIWDHKYSCDNDIRKMLISWGSNGIISLSRGDDEVNDSSRPYFATSTSSKLIQLDYPTEYIKAMEGWFNVEPNGDAVLKELTFESNIATYGPYGDKKGFTYGTYFRTPCNIGKITGFYGRRSGDRRLSSIGAYFGPVYHLHPLKTIGPFGDYFSGTQWDDGSHSGIRQINLRSGTVIDSVTLVYDDGNGGSLQGEKHGKDGGSPTEMVLDYPNEYLVAMTGYIGTLGSCLCVRSLTFETNKRKLGPYGKPEGKDFSIRSNIGKIVGLYGSSSVYLYSIGAHIQLL